MLDKILGNISGGGMLTTIARNVSGAIGSYIDSSSTEIRALGHTRYILDNFIINQDIYSQHIPIVLGKARIDGKLIWCDTLKEMSYVSTQSFISGKPKSTIHDVEHKYSLSFAISICEGEIKDIVRVWVGEELIDLTNYKFRLHKGTQDQLPDPLIESLVGKGECPAFRDHAYIVLEDFPLIEFSHSLPCFSFEVHSKVITEEKMSVEDEITSMIIIPGSGEYVYDTEIVYKYILAANGKIIAEEPMNSCNYKNIANSLENLDQLAFTCKNLQWTAPVVCWFTDSLNIKDCKVMPAVECQEKDVLYSEKWQVGTFNRQTAHEISKDQNNNPRYGGTTSDNSVVRYLAELKIRKYKILFYPILYIDNQAKSWRGHIIGDPEHVYEFFNKEKGYNEFILHYATLVKGKVDAFIIGSELIGITKIRDHKNEFVAVMELMNLARKVKQILGNEVLITYAADWSEYHHTEGGWYNLDQLWASHNIDFIGIDAYFPLTSTNKAVLSDSEILKGFSSGEGYDYYVDGDTRKALTPEWAWKNIDYWWNNEHINPDGNKTDWQPRSKKIWFTEFGFPSIDKSTNQPNIFFDPQCINGGIPHYSSGEVDFVIQRRAIKLAIQYFKSQTYLDSYFLWTWDARPSPAWPFLDYWNDSYLWSRGHWVNNKFTSVSLSSLLQCLCFRAGIDRVDINVSSLDEGLEGIVFSRDITILDAINLLRLIYLFDVDASGMSGINFIKRGYNDPEDTICTQNLAITDIGLIKNIDHSYLEAKLSFSLSFFNKFIDYKIDHVHRFDDETQNILKHSNIFVPVVIARSDAKIILSKLIDHSKKETKEIIFSLPQFMARLNPGSVFTYQDKAKNCRARILYSMTENHLTKYGAVIEDQLVYTRNQLSFQSSLTGENNINIMTGLCELPYIPYSNLGSCFYYGHTRGCGKRLYSSSNNSPQSYIQTLRKNAIIAIVKEFHNTDKLYQNLIDYDSKIQLFSYSQFPEFSIDEYYLGKSLCIFGQEIIAYTSVKHISNRLYEISGLIRGLYGTHNAFDTHQAGEKFMLLSSLEKIPISSDSIGENIGFSVNSRTDHIIYEGNTLLLQIYNLSYKVLDKMLLLEWQYEAELYDNWIAPTESGFIYKIVITHNHLMYKFETTKKSISISCSALGLSGQCKISIIVVRKEDYIESKSVNTTIHFGTSDAN